MNEKNTRSVRRRATMALLAGTLAACTTSYVSPQGPERAKLRIKNTSSRTMGVTMYRDAAECRDRQVLKPMLDPGQEVSIYVPTGTFTLTMSQDTGASSTSVGLTIVGCNPTFTFSAEKSKSYTAEFGRAGSCSYTLVETDSAGDDGQLAFTPTKITERSWIAPFGEAGPFCTRRR